MYTDKIVQKISKGSQVIYSREDISLLVEPGWHEGENTPTIKRRIAATISRLKAEDILIPIKNGLFIVRKHIGDERFIVEDLYWSIVKKVITRTCGSDYIISGATPLRMHMRNMSPPPTLYVMTRNIHATISLSPSFKVLFRPVTKKGTSLYNQLKPMSEVISHEGSSFRISGIEMSILESLMKRAGGDTIDTKEQHRAFTKLLPLIDIQKLETLTSLQYILPLNRLREYIKHEKKYEGLYTAIMKIIRGVGKGQVISIK